MHRFHHVIGAIEVVAEFVHVQEHALFLLIAPEIIFQCVQQALRGDRPVFIHALLNRVQGIRTGDDAVNLVAAAAFHRAAADHAFAGFEEPS